MSLGLRSGQAVPGCRGDRSGRPFEFVVIRVDSWFGMAFDLQPNLKGRLVELRPLRPEDWHALFTVASDPLIWEQHPERDRHEKDVFQVFFREALESGGAFVVIDRSSQQIIGSTRFYGYDPEKSEIEIGWTFLARKYWGGRYNAEMKRLLLNHAFTFVQNVVFYVGEKNIRSQKAMEKIGAIRKGTAARAYGNHPPALNVKYVIQKRDPLRLEGQRLSERLDRRSSTAATVKRIHVHSCLETLLVLVVAVPPGIGTFCCLLVALIAMNFLPFHFPFSVLELRDGDPRFG